MPVSSGIAIGDTEWSTCGEPNAVFGPTRASTRPPGEARSAGPAAGAHNTEVYGGWLGLSDAERAALERSGVI